VDLSPHGGDLGRRAKACAAEKKELEIKAVYQLRLHHPSGITPKPAAGARGGDEGTELVAGKGIIDQTRSES